MIKTKYRDIAETKNIKTLKELMKEKNLFENNPSRYYSTL